MVVLLVQPAMAAASSWSRAELEAKYAKLEKSHKALRATAKQKFQTVAEEVRVRWSRRRLLPPHDTQCHARLACLRLARVQVAKLKAQLAASDAEKQKSQRTLAALKAKTKSFVVRPLAVLSRGAACFSPQ